MIYLGIDPGASGGFATTDNGLNITLHPMPKTERAVWDWVRDLKFNTKGYVVAVIEKVTGYVSGNPRTGASMFTFGASYGGLRMALIAAGIRFEAVTPAVWQKGVGITPRKKSEDRDDFKRRLKAKAEELFSGVGVTLATCDALLIAEYARRNYR